MRGLAAALRTAVSVGRCLPIKVVSLNVGRYLRLPFVTVVQELFLVVKELLVGLGGELKVGTLHDGVDRASLLTESAVDALCHVDVVAGCPAGAVRALLSLDGDGLGRANSLAKLARDATLLAGRIPAQCVLPAKSR